ncbi:MAG: UDP-N-acetylglucosamine--N-acetylmuramyl-(pentapeptide) pyrophosphoryl-undecaprenol N-acetylglucosamine transferase [Chloroflexi bacterium]|nr:UDP-N-acetylglucosamine--N-acetylmuramyl-(pentapeptide) pyrophosphoryl-undecaprenol N-acetylglucosamine transferase [Chloroflexota bacterium]
MRLALTAGGTGGHIFPALAVLDAVLARDPATEVRFFGPDNRGERRMVESRGVAFETVSAAGVRGRGPLQVARSLWRVLAGTLAAARRLRAFHADVVFSTGGYASFPASLAARLLRRPLVVYLPDVAPGWAVRAEQRLATRMATTTDAALAYLPAKKTAVTGYPVRPEFFSVTREEARARLGIDAAARLVLVAGASQGARALNRAVFDNIRQLAAESTVIHITGAADIAEALALKDSLDSGIAGRYLPASFRDDMPIAMLAADVAVMRAGASVLGELPAAGLPAILVPGTFAGGHQRDNARWLADAGAAVILEETAIATLPAALLGLLNDRARLEAMRAAAEGLARPDAAADIAAIISEVAKR